MNKPMDVEAERLTTMYKHHIRYDYKTTAAHDSNEERFRKEFAFLLSIPVSEFSQSVWDDLNELFCGG